MKRRINQTKLFGALMLMTFFTLVFTSCQKENVIPSESEFSSTTSVDLKQGPDVPEIIAVPAGNRVIWHAYATGVQIYQVQQSTTDPNVYLWVFLAPSATLFSDAGLTHQVGTHYIGPTWKVTTGRKNGEFVVGVKLQGITQDATAVAWLLLQAVPNSDPNYFNEVTYIQRINTAGGLAPTTGADADHLGEQVEIPYTAEYYFFGSN
ncbi:MAG: DUF3455 domain-containing protein [Chitinophagaceae bacterium]|nr:DUF3455 domain-containing protein [Chitinophagaceae bacterium]